VSKRISSILGLIAIDQVIKLAISRFALNALVILIPGALYFHPVQNTNLNWFASMASLQTPVWLMVVIQATILLLILAARRFFTYRSGCQPLLEAFTVFIAAGIGCSFVDVVFWGGSLDFMGLFHWFIFDTKDVYLNTASVFLILWVIKREKEHSQKPQGPSGWPALLQWLKAGCPAQKL
jgi:signal peptidase II